MPTTKLPRIRMDSLDVFTKKYNKGPTNYPIQDFRKGCKEKTLKKSALLRTPPLNLAFFTGIIKF